MVQGNRYFIVNIELKIRFSILFQLLIFIPLFYYFKLFVYFIKSLGAVSYILVDFDFSFLEKTAVF